MATKAAARFPGACGGGMKAASNGAMSVPPLMRRSTSPMLAFDPPTSAARLV